jgi:hypothetical protein
MIDASAPKSDNGGRISAEVVSAPAGPTGVSMTAPQREVARDERAKFEFHDDVV